MDSNMLGYPTTKTTPLINLTSNSRMASKTLRAAETAAHPTPPLSSIAKTVTRYLFGETALPPFLEGFGHLLAFTGGAAIASGLHNFFQRNKDDRGKIQLAVFHVVRFLKNFPDLEERIQRPQELLATIDEEINRMTGVHLTKSEGAATMLTLKRKIGAELDARMKREEATKRRRTDSPAAGDDDDDDDAMSDHSVEGDVRFSEADFEIPEVVFQPPSVASELEEKPSQEEELPEEENSDGSMLDSDSQSQAQAPVSYTGPVREQPLLAPPGFDLNLNEPLPVQNTRPSKSTPRGGLGCGKSHGADNTPVRSGSSPPLRGNIISHDEDAEPILRPPKSNLLRGQAPSFEHADTPRPKKAQRTEYGRGPRDHDIYVSTASRKDNSPVRETPPTHTTTSDVRGRSEDSNAQKASKTAQKPRNTISLLQPPSAMAVKTQGAVDGSRLFSIREGRSPHLSPLEDSTQYRVAESRKLHRNFQKERGERRLFNKYIPKARQAPQQIDGRQIPETVQEEEQDEQEKLGQPVQSGTDELLEQALGLQTIAENTMHDTQQEETHESDEEEMDTGEKIPNSTLTSSDDEGEDEMMDFEQAVPSPPPATPSKAKVMPHHASSSSSSAHRSRAPKATPTEHKSFSPSFPATANSSPFRRGTALPSSHSPLPITAASPAVRHVPPPPGAQSASSHSSPDPIIGGSSPKKVIKSSAQKSPALSPPNRRKGRRSKAKKSPEAPQTHVETKSARKRKTASQTPAKSKTAQQTPGTRKSARVAERKRAEKK